SARVMRYSGDHPEAIEDQVAREEPLEIRIAGEAMAVTMRTPGHDAELVLGFLIAEGIVSSLDDVGGIAHCGRPGTSGNVVEVTAAPGRVLAWDPDGAGQRVVNVSSACGVCGRRSIDDLLARIGRIEDETRFAAAWVRGLTRELSPRQANFASSGGVHAAALWDGERRLHVVREDIGRHNAVDKVIGRCAFDRRLPARGCALVVSGRAGFEIVQKAAVAHIPLVVSVSAPSSLAIAAAEQSGMTLVGFARGERFNVYSCAERIVAA
ncbi:MAG TPA: formate dehydrogenase accessory sulfurtransferase FdhD, partial [Polyangiaceae bacterium]|nr:formate dehydrogenase accessory sulfurtransferase FdhD [Polyangiaceae bacterium]